MEERAEDAALAASAMAEVGMGLAVDQSMATVQVVEVGRAKY